MCERRTVGGGPYALHVRPLEGGLAAPALHSGRAGWGRLALARWAFACVRGGGLGSRLGYGVGVGQSPPGSAFVGEGE